MYDCLSENPVNGIEDGRSTVESGADTIGRTGASKGPTVTGQRYLWSCSLWLRPRRYRHPCERS